MKIQWIRRDKNMFKVDVDESEDKWYLSHVLEPGDSIRARTQRKIKIGMPGSQKTVRKTFTLTICVEDVSYEPSLSSLRVKGKITSCPDEVSKGSYHSFNIEEGKTITVMKNKLTTYHVKKLEEATTPSAKVLLALVDRGEARFARLTPQGYEEISSMTGEVEKKAYDTDVSENFYAVVAEKLDEYTEKYDANQVVLGSQSFWKELVEEHVSEKVQSKLLLATVNRTDVQGFEELVKRPELASALENDRAVQDGKIVDRLMEAVREEKACYSYMDCREKQQLGAVDELIVSEKYLKEQKNRGRYSALEHLLRSVEDMDGDVWFISGEEATKRLDGLGGIGGILRWKA